jgi:hypothetical protein
LAQGSFTGDLSTSPEARQNGMLEIGRQPRREASTEDFSGTAHFNFRNRDDWQEFHLPVIPLEERKQQRSSRSVQTRKESNDGRQAK